MSLAPRTVVARAGAVGKSACLAQLLEHHAVHAAAEILVEDGLHGHFIGVPRAVFVVILHHVDVLGVVGGYEHLVDGRLLLGVFPACGHGSELLRRLVKARHERSYLLLAIRTVVEHGVLHAVEALEQVGQHLRTCGAQLSLAQRVCIAVVRTVYGIRLQASEVGALVLLGVRARFHKQVYILFV